MGIKEIKSMEDNLYFDLIFEYKNLMVEAFLFFYNKEI